MLRRTVFRLPLLVPFVATPLAAVTPAQAGRQAFGDVQLATPVTSSRFGIGHTIRHADGSWDGLGYLGANIELPHNFASAIVNGEEHLLYQGYNRVVNTTVNLHQIRHADGSWTNVQIPVGDPSPGTLAVATVSGELHVVKRYEDGTLRHSARHSGGTWSPVTVVPVPEGTTGAAATGADGELRVMVRSQLGEVLYLVARHPDGTWTPAERVGFLPLPRIVANQVDIAQVGADLHAVVRATNRQLYHAIRRANGSWTAFGNATNEAGALSGDLMDISVTAAGGQLQVAVCTTDSGLFHTIRFLDGNWQRFGDVKQVAGSDVGYEVTIAGE